jgi:hypothetical protein
MRRPEFLLHSVPSADESTRNMGRSFLNLEVKPRAFRYPAANSVALHRADAGGRVGGLRTVLRLGFRISTAQSVDVPILETPHEVSRSVTGGAR